MANEENNDDRLKKIFVGGLNRSTKNDGLKAYFETYGDMSDCVVITDSQTKESRGFGYVTFENKESVIEVLKDKKEKGAHTIDGKEVEVKRAIPKDDDSATARLKTKKIFIGGLKDEATADDIQQSLITAVRGITPTSVDLIMKKQDDGGPSKHRGFCFVEFEDEDIVDELCCLKKVNICGKMVEVKKAEPKDKDSRGQGGRGGRGGGRGGPGGGRGRGRGGDQGGHHYGGYPGSGYNQYGGYGGGDSSYYGSGYEGAYDYYGMGAYQQAPSGYGPQGGYGRGAGGERYRPY